MGSAETVDHILRTARSAGATLIVPRGHDPVTIGRMLELGLVRERLGHLIVTLEGQQRRRASASF